MALPLALAADVDDAVSDAGDGFDRLWFAEFAAQPTDGDLDGLGEGVGVLVPDLFEQVFGAEWGWGGAHDCFEEGELLDGQVAGVPGAGDGATQWVEFDACRGEGAGVGGGLAAGERADA